MSRKIEIGIIMVVCLLTQTSIVIAQSTFADNINQVDSVGLREGLWIEEYGQLKRFNYYQRGILNGPCWITSTYSKRLLAYGEFFMGTYSGTWYSFDDNGILLSIQKDFKKVSVQIPAIHRIEGFCSSQCYHISFYPNGSKKSEGILLWDVSPDSDFTFEFGEWKYYDNKGRLTCIKRF